MRAGNARVAARHHLHGARQLAGKERARLAAEHAAAVALGPAITAVHDDLGPAIRWNRLRIDFPRGTFENPEPLDKRRERGGRTELPIENQSP